MLSSVLLHACRFLSPYVNDLFKDSKSGVGEYERQEKEWRLLSKCPKCGNSFCHEVFRSSTIRQYKCRRCEKSFSVDKSKGVVYPF